MNKNLAQRPSGMGWGRGGREAQEGGISVCMLSHSVMSDSLQPHGVCVYIICITVWQKPTQYCKAIILHLKFLKSKLSKAE